jgi:hypothetical protein
MSGGGGPSNIVPIATRTAHEMDDDELFEEIESRIGGVVISPDEMPPREFTVTQRELNGMPFPEAERIRRVQEFAGISPKIEKVIIHDKLIKRLLNSDIPISPDEQGELNFNEHRAFKDYRDFQKKVREYTSSIANLEAKLEQEKRFLPNYRGEEKESCIERIKAYKISLSKGEENLEKYKKLLKEKRKEIICKFTSEGQKPETKSYCNISGGKRKTCSKKHSSKKHSSKKHKKKSKKHNSKKQSHKH